MMFKEAVPTTYHIDSNAWLKHLSGVSLIVILGSFALCGNSLASESEGRNGEAYSTSHKQDIMWLRERIGTTPSEEDLMNVSSEVQLDFSSDFDSMPSTEINQSGVNLKPAHKPIRQGNAYSIAKKNTPQIQRNETYYDYLNDIEPVAGGTAVYKSSDFIPVSSDDMDTADSQQSSGLLSILAHTHKTNPVLKAQRQQLRISHEDIFEAEAGWLPNVTAEVAAASVLQDIEPGGTSDNLSKKLSLSVSQPVYRSGRTQHAVSREKSKSLATYEEYMSSTQSVFISAIEAYLDVVTAKSVLNLNKANEKRLIEVRDSVQEQYDVGQLTITDVSQAQARVAGAASEVVKAEGQLNSHIASFYHVTSMEIPEDKFTFPTDTFFELPKALNIAIRNGLDAHPDVKAAQYKMQASSSDVSANTSTLLPEIALNGALEQEYDPNPGLLDSSSSASLSLSATVPLFNSGVSRSRVRRSKIAKYVERNNYESVRRDIRENVTKKWEDYQTAAAVITSTQAQLDAAKIAREGVHEEKELGTRTVIDALDADQELLDAEVAVVEAQKSYILSRFSLAASMGHLMPEHVGLKRMISVKDMPDSRKRLRNILSTDVDSRDKR